MKGQPALVLRTVSQERLGIRLMDIGRRQRFNMILSRLRFDFPLADCEELDHQPWWIIASSQREQVKDFCCRNGLQLIEVR